MRILLLTGTPPGARGVGEVVLRDLVLHHGPESVRCAAVVSTTYVHQPDARLPALPVQLLPTAHLRARRWNNGRFGGGGSLWHYITGFRREVRRLRDSIVNETPGSEVDLVLAVLNNPLMFPLAHRVARALGRPLVTLVWDPPEYLLRYAKFDRLSRRWLLREFRRSLAYSSRTAVVSNAMREEYSRLTSGPAGIMRHAVAVEFDTVLPARRKHHDEAWVIGFAGRMYAGDAWTALLNGLDLAGWSINGRPVRIKVLAPHITLASRAAACIDYLGYPPPEETLQALRDCDITYLPQPFLSDFCELSRLSFPTKLTTCLALGRPVFIHCQADSALSQFFDDHPIGIRCTSLEAGPIIGALEDFFGSPRRYEQACEEVQRAARAHFDLPVFHRAIDWLLGPLDDIGPTSRLREEAKS